MAINVLARDALRRAYYVPRARRQESPRLHYHLNSLDMCQARYGNLKVRDSRRVVNSLSNRYLAAFVTCRRARHFHNFHNANERDL